MSPSPPVTLKPRRRWRRRVGFGLTILAVLAIVIYAVRITILLSVARIALDNDAALEKQERADGLSLTFAALPSVWTRPMKNLMNPIWDPVGADGINYFAFAGPRNLLGSFSERSNPRSPYYQAWVGGYVTKRRDGTLPDNLPEWAAQVTALDQRSWLAAMGDPRPLAEMTNVSIAGMVDVDGRRLPLWHGVMRSHSDLSESPRGPLATVVGMPPKSSWPGGLTAFHEVTLHGYFVCWSDIDRKVSVVIYAVTVDNDALTKRVAAPAPAVEADLLRILRSAKSNIVR